MSTASRWKTPGARTRFRFSELREKPDHLRLLEEWMRSYKPEELFDEKGTFRDELADLAPKGRLRMGMNRACQWRPAAAAAEGAELPRLRGED